MKRETMSNVDTAWLRMEHPNNLMMISGILVFKNRLDFPRFRQLVHERLFGYDRFRQKVVRTGNLRNPEWVEDHTQDMDYHLARLFLNDTRNESEFKELIGELISTPLDYERPLWQFHVIDDYNGGSVLVGRIHHCIGDGTALVRVLLSLTDASPDAIYSSSSEPQSTSTNPPRPRSFLGNLAAVTEKAWRFGARMVEGGKQTLMEPSRIVAAAKMGAVGVTALSKLALRSADPKTRFKGELGRMKKGVWSQQIPLDEVKAIGKASGGTVNDVLLTAMTGALRRYLEHHNESVERLNLRAAVPVNLRPMSNRIELGNKFGLVFPSLPLGIADSAKRMKSLQKRMNALKNSPEAMITLGALNAAAVAPKEIQDFVINFLGAKTSAVMTNVPGPRETIFMAGSAIEDIIFWVPQSGRVALGVSIFSYAGKVVLGVAADELRIPDPERILEAFHQEFNQLKSLYLPAPSKAPAS